jgi:hypothetical protein
VKPKIGAEQKRVIRDVPTPVFSTLLTIERQVSPNGVSIWSGDEIAGQISQLYVLGDGKRRSSKRKPLTNNGSKFPEKEGGDVHDHVTIS